MSGKGYLQYDVHATNRSDITSSPFQPHICILPAILIAVTAFLLNLLQMIAICRKSKAQDNTTARFLLALMGICSCVPCFWYVAAIAQPKLSTSFFESRDLCFLVPSGFLLFSLLGMGIPLNYHILDEYMSSINLKAGATRKLVLCTSGFAGLLAMLPSCGWNNWQGRCCLPHVWSLGFILLFTIVYFFYVVFNVLILVKSIVSKMRQNRTVTPSLDGTVLDNGTRRNRAPYVDIIPLAVHCGTTIAVVIYAGNVKVNQQSPSIDCTLDVKMIWFVLLLASLSVFMPVWSLITSAEARETTMAVFQPLWNLVPEDVGRNSVIKSVQDKILKSKTEKPEEREMNDTRDKVPDPNEVGG